MRTKPLGWPSTSYVAVDMLHSLQKFNLRLRLQCVDLPLQLQSHHLYSHGALHPVAVFYLFISEQILSTPEAGGALVHIENILPGVPVNNLVGII